MAELAPYALFLTVEPNHIVCYANRAFCALVGKPAEALIRRPLAEVLPQCAKSGAVAFLNRIYRTGEPGKITNLPHLDSKKELRLWSYSAWPALEGKHDPPRLLVQVSDTTEQALDRSRYDHTNKEIRHANERLVVASVRMQELADEAEAARQRLSMLAEASRLLVTSPDVSNTLGGVAQLMVPELADGCAFYLLNEQGALEATATSIGDTSSPLDDALTLTARTALGGGEPLLWAQSSNPPPLDGPNGETVRSLRELGFSVALCLPLQGRARLLGVLSLVAKGAELEAADVTLLRELADRVALALDRSALYAEALAAVRARDDLLATVSHDLRNPLSAMVMSITLLSEHLSTESYARVGQHVDRMRRTAERMQRLLQDLVEGAKIAAGGLSLEPERQEVVPLLLEAVEMLTPLSAQKSVRMEANLTESAANAVALVDGARLVQVFTNLLHNAIKATPEGGCITAGAERSGDALQISIRDTGPGITPEDLPHLFDRFWQARRHAQLGVGLGLFIAKGIVEAHNGRIWVESTPGVGSVFFVSLPLVTEGAP